MNTKKFTDNYQSDILCPLCGSGNYLIVRTNRHNGNQFLGCSKWPDCEYTRGIPEEWIMRIQGQRTLFDLSGDVKKEKKQ